MSNGAARAGLMIVILLGIGGSTVRAGDEFPIGVWQQAPANAPRYKAIGINRFVGLWEGPTREQLTLLEKAGMPVFCDQNKEALDPRWKNEIVGWLQSDEPDNAQDLPDHKGYGPPISPAEIVRRYQAIHAADPDRPVMLNLGQGVAWDDWYGRGNRTHHPEDYPLYIRGGDIVSFDIYPETHDDPAVAGKPWFVAHGVARLVEWTAGKKPVWACIECTHIGNAQRKPTPQQVKSEVWMALISGAHGFLYFAHQFKPTFVEAALLADAPMSQAVAQINAQVQELADPLNAAPQSPGAAVETTPLAADGPRVICTTRKVGEQIYVFAVGVRPDKCRAGFSLPKFTGDGAIDVIGESRTLPAPGGKWEDDFDEYQVHLYRLARR